MKTIIIKKLIPHLLKKILSIMRILISGILLISCSALEEPISPALKEPILPKLTTTDVTGITSSSAISGGSITSEGDAAVTERGVCWSTNTAPTIKDSITIDGAGSGSFTSIMTGLISNTKYYVRAYATNQRGTGYGAEVSFTTLPETIVTDIEGNVYKTIKIGNQVWMAENLKTTTYNDGTPIGYITYIGSSQNPQTLPPGYCWPQNDSLNKNSYGALYNWFVVNTGKIAPTGWHVPSENDFKILINYLGGESMAGQKLDELGFKAQGAGQLGYMGTWVFNLFPDLDKYWTTTAGGWEPTDIKYLCLTRINPAVNWSSHSKTAAHSIRCIKD